MLFSAVRLTIIETENFARPLRASFLMRIRLVCVDEGLPETYSIEARYAAKLAATWAVTPSIAPPP